jgi:coenzyme F420-reducing hydrogenase alpha subunit
VNHAPVANPEGALRLRLRVAGGAVTEVRLQSTRPDVARTLLGGRPRDDAAAIVPRLFSVCSQSQAAASALACAAAAGEAPDASALERWRAAVAAETLRETAWRTLLDWPRALGENPDAGAIAAARRAASAEAHGATARAAVAAAVFGNDADAFLAIDDLVAFDRWAERGATAAARHVGRARDDDTAAAVADAPLLHAGLAPWEAVAAAIDADPRFASAPLWHGAPAETGALARRADDPLVRALLRRHPSRAPARFVARLRELAQLLVGDEESVVGARSLPGGRGLAWVENARGLLVHDVRLAGGRIGRYTIVAPTEWNFHPAGVLAQTLAGSPAGDPDGLRRRAGRLVHSLDPCVACEVTVDDA